MRRLPLLPTLVVATAVAAMVALGIWQIRRAHEKEALLARYAAARGLPPTALPLPPGSPLPLFRSATALCARPEGKRASAGQNRQGESGFVQIVDCRMPGTQRLSVELGWSKDPNARFDWSGGLVSGIVAPDRRRGMRLVAATAPPGLEPSAEPSLDSIPNNHRFYALQWFAFAAIALVVYGLALRRRRAERDER